MEIPDYIPGWVAWVMLSGAVLQAIGLVTVSGRLRAPEAAARSKARLDLLDTVGALLFFVGFALGQLIASPWLWLCIAGFLVTTSGYMVKGVRLRRARRRATG
ncbi:hypothetical protein OHB33_37810 (plasmid) [Streptomyces sp. NBC_01558]|uniref:hypothetical protein n=1 Tax=Streptomyces sp. NBC_01558 TaxID=2975878 RepID=UPI002DDB9A16|nr:hypothetical protein [Streptomyces sp. NBC_01558]WSD82154.1 hypothetical protein OHB33_37810 [Streptomyces sp. NBC_01558]